MKCANCGNDNPKKLFDEGDTIYCQVCYHRTLTSNGKDDLVWCTNCGKLRDRKAMYCMWCNGFQGDHFTKKEFDEELGITRDFIKTLTPDNVLYWKKR